MEFEDTGLPDTERLRRAYEYAVSYYEQTSFLERLQPLGPDISARDAKIFSDHKIGCAKLIGDSGISVSEEQMAALLVSDAVKAYPHIVDEFDRDTRDTIDFMRGGEALFNRATKEGRLKEFLSNSGYTSEEGAMARVSLIQSLRTLSEMNLSNQAKQASSAMTSTYAETDKILREFAPSAHLDKKFDEARTQFINAMGLHRVTPSPQNPHIKPDF